MYIDSNKEKEENSTNMYTPGICADKPQQPEYFRGEPSFEPRNTKKLTPGAFLRSVCLVLACVFLSAAATYAVIEFRIIRGDFDSNINQVILGRPNPPADEYQAAPLTGTPEGGMPAEDIYDLALTQVVGISANAPMSGGIFGLQGTMPSVTGSGFIVSEDGYILTNYHVIETAHYFESLISVTLHDGTAYDAEIIGFDASNDVAVLKIEESGFVPSYIGDSSKLRVGQSIYAVGNPFGDLVYTMTDGIVSALDRVVTVEGKLINAFQFSAAVNSGNSGGPVYNTSGEIVGIVTAKVIRGNIEGIGFAIPINDAISIATAIIEHGYISGRPQLGIVGQPVSEANADYYDWVTGVYVRTVNPGSAADKAGIKVGDIITALEGEEVTTTDNLKFIMRRFSAGDTVNITIWRNGEVLELPVTFDEDMNAGRPELTPPPSPDSPDPFEDIP